MENRALSCFQSRGPLFFFVASLPFSLSLSLPPFLPPFFFSLFMYICLYIFFFYSFLNSFFLRLSLFRWSRLRVRKARGLFSGVRFVWCTELNRVYIDGDWCVELVDAVIFFCSVCLIEIIQFCRMNCECICLSLVSFVQFFLRTGLSLKVCLFIMFMKNIVNRYYNNRSNYDNFLFYYIFALIFLPDNYMM